MPCWPTLLRLRVTAFTAAEDGCSAQTETKMKCPASASKPGSFGLHHYSRECYLKAGTETQQKSRPPEYSPEYQPAPQRWPRFPAGSPQRSGGLMPPSFARLQLQSSRWRRYRRAPLQSMTPLSGAIAVRAVRGPNSVFPGSHFLG